jgi:hypothetical protein
VCKHSNKKRERNKRDTNWKGRSQFIHIWRWYDPIKILKNFPKTLRSD